MAKAGIVPDCNDCDMEYDGSTDGHCCTVIFCDKHKAAPELLDACLKMIEITGGSSYWNGETNTALKLMEAAVARAGGKPSEIERKLSAAAELLAALKQVPHGVLECSRFAHMNFGEVGSNRRTCDNTGSPPCPECYVGVTISNAERGGLKA